MAIRRALGGIISPTTEELKAIGKQYHFEISDEELDYFSAVIEGFMPAYRKIEALPDPKPPVKYPRTPGYQPTADENPLNAWYWRTSIKGAPSGKLAGKTVAVKDTISLAGVPMMVGSAVMEGFMPDYDATVVTRILDAGGEIVGKATCEDFCCSGSSQTSVPRPGPQPAQPRLLRRRIFQRQRRPRGRRRLRHGARRRPGRLDPHPRRPGRRRRPQAHLVPRPLHWHRLRRRHHRPRRPHDPLGRGHRPPPGGDRRLRPRRCPPEPGHQSRGVHQGLHRRSQGPPHRHPGGRLRLGRRLQGLRTPPSARPPTPSSAPAPLSARPPSPCTATAPTSGPPSSSTASSSSSSCSTAPTTAARGFYDTRAIDYMGRSRKTMADNFPAGVKLLALHGHYMLEHYNGRYYAKSQNQRKLITAVLRRRLQGL